MAKRVGGSKRKARHKLTKNVSLRGKIKISEYLKQLNTGDRVQVLLEAAVHKGQYHLRYYGKMGIINGKDGECYKVLIKDFTKEKILVVHPVHLKKI
jgi:large subunit ribosomal protein L21e